MLRHLGKTLTSLKVNSMPYRTKEERNAYYKEYYYRDVERSRARSRKYWQNRSEEIKLRNKEKRNSDIGRYKNYHWKNDGFKNKDGSLFQFVHYQELYKIQKGCCDICGIYSAKLSRSLSIDHNHITNFTRGLLCNKCNLAVGFIENNKMLLKEAVQYLRRHGEKIKLI